MVSTVLLEWVLCLFGSLFISNRKMYLYGFLYGLLYCILNTIIYVLLGPIGSIVYMLIMFIIQGICGNELYKLYVYKRIKYILLNNTISKLIKVKLADKGNTHIINTILLYILIYIMYVILFFTVTIYGLMK